MRPSQPVFLLLRLALVAAFVYLAVEFGNRLLEYRSRDLAKEREQAAKQAAFLKTYGGDSVRILQFYARDAQLVEGRSTVLCYGVLNARSVRMEPAVEALSPALSRCVTVAPIHDTRYTLTVEGTDGQTVAESLTLAVGADPETLPRIPSFGVARQGIDRGRAYFVLSFTAENAELVEIDPPVIPPLHGAPMGQFTVAPEKRTTYTLTVTGKHGRKVSRSVTVGIY